MNQNVISTHTDEYLKRQAKKIKKELNVPYIQALDKAAEQVGFNNWKHFLNGKSIAAAIKNRISKSKSVLENKISKKTIDPYRNLIIAGTNELIKKNLSIWTVPKMAKKMVIFLQIY